LGRKGSALVERAREILTRNGHDVTVAPTTGPGSAGAIARSAVDSGVDLVIAAGGDGTINEVMEGMVHSTTPLAILPGGTANVLAAEVKLGAKLDQVLHSLPELCPRRISVGHLTCDGGRVSRHFLLMAGVGMDAHVVYNVSAAVKSRTGKLAYWLAGARLMGHRLAQLEAEIDGLKYSCSFALISKVRNYGGDFEIARSVTLLDDEFEVVLFEGNFSFQYVKYFIGMATRRLKSIKGVTILRANCVTVSALKESRAYVQIDGEFAGHLPAEIRIVPEAVTLLMPAGYGIPG
jgi:diacylglycerol kinase (ATP)